MGITIYTAGATCLPVALIFNRTAIPKLLEKKTLRKNGLPVRNRLPNSSSGITASGKCLVSWLPRLFWSPLRNSISESSKPDSECFRRSRQNYTNHFASTVKRLNLPQVLSITFIKINNF
jgi:hypothetical protein